MSISELFQTSWKIYRRNPVIWSLSIIIAIVTAFNMLAPSGSSADKTMALLACGFVCFSFFLDFFYAFVEAGLIQTVDNDQKGQPTSLRDVWGTFRSRFGSLILVVLIAIAGMAVLFIAVFFVVAILITLAKWNAEGVNSAIIVVLTLIMTPLLLVIQFAFRAIILEPNGSFSSISHGMQVLFKNFWKALLIVVIYMVVQTVLQAVVSIIYFGMTNSSQLSLLAGGGLFSNYAALILSPASRVLMIFLTPVLLSIYSIALTLIYLQASPKPAPSIQLENPV